MSHTPGPWAVDEDSVHDQWTDSLSIVAPDGGVVAYTTRGGGFFYTAPDPRAGDQSPAWPNAHLIAAAPDLLAACKFLISIIDVARPVGAESPIPAIKAAIAKAEGR